jgi:hypothetical protein
LLDKNYSDYVIYVDESGDHGLVSIDPQYPIFVLVFCIFKKSEYIKNICPSMQEFKFRFFGHDSVVLHSSDIRKSKDSFSLLLGAEYRLEFMKSLSSMVDGLKFFLVATVVDKNELKKKHIEPENPYEIALRSCIEGAYNFLRDNNQHNKVTHIVIEKRGRQEDDGLELAFRRIVQGDNFKHDFLFGLDLPFEMVFADKKFNSNGLQIADLMAYPIGTKFLRPEQANKAYEIVRSKFYKGDQDLRILP